MVQSFYFRTCVDPTLVQNDDKTDGIRYSSLTADVFAKSDEGLDCVNDVEIAYFCLMGVVLFLGFVSFLRLSKVFNGNQLPLVDLFYVTCKFIRNY